jgi:hypothetical protein
MNGTGDESAMTVIGALSSFRKRREMNPHKRACCEEETRSSARIFSTQNFFSSKQPKKRMSSPQTT